MKKNPLTIITIIVVILVTLSAPLALYFGIFFTSSRFCATSDEFEKYYSELNRIEFWENDHNSLIPQTAVYSMISSHVYDNNSGKIPKVLFIGIDGVQAATFNYMDKEHSGVNDLITDGGTAYLLQTGGKIVGEQNTSTAPGWATLFTGEWATRNLVATNGCILNFDTKSIMYSLAADGYETSFNVSWPRHVKYTYSLEVASAQSKRYPITYTLNADDKETHMSMLNAIQNTSQTAVFGIYEETDLEGHRSGHYLCNEKYLTAYRNIDAYAKELIDAVKARDTFDDEDWLIIFANDHGGVIDIHGGSTPMEYITFVVTNKSFDGVSYEK